MKRYKENLEYCIRREKDALALGSSNDWIESFQWMTSRFDDNFTKKVEIINEYAEFLVKYSRMVGEAAMTHGPVPIHCESENNAFIGLREECHKSIAIVQVYLELVDNAPVSETPENRETLEELRNYPSFVFLKGLRFETLEALDNMFYDLNA